MTAKAAFRAFAEAFRHPGPGWEAAVGAFVAPGAMVNVVHPFNEGTGPGAYLALLDALRGSFDGLHRRDYIAFGGRYAGADWVTATGYWAGHFAADFLGIRATGALAWLRFGEFHRMDGGRSVESYVFLDLPELMIAAGVWPVSEYPGAARGYAGMLPGPATGDGVNWGEADSARSTRSAEIVTAMLRKLATPDEAWRPYWHPNMMWYGPAAFGSFVGVERFAGFQVPFESAFEGWSGGAAGNGMTAHFTRFGEGDYVCSGGWPSLTGVQVKPFLGCPATGRRVFMRVCDWWRLEGELCVENWVFVDIPHVLLQLGRDVLAEVAG